MFTVKISESDFKDPQKWQKIAKDLELPPDRDEAIVTRIPGLLPVAAGMEIKQPDVQLDEWLWADNVGGSRSYVIHTREPRFIARIDEDAELHPPFEYAIADGEVLCNFVWLDPPPEDLTALLAEAESFVIEYDEQLEAEK